MELELRQQETLEIANRVERALMTMAVHAQQLDDRISSMEERGHDTNARIEQLPTHADLLSVRVHSAQVMTELAALNLELNSEIEAVRSEMRAAAAASTPVAPSPAPATPATTLAPAAEAEQAFEWDNDIDLREAPAFLRPDSAEYHTEDISWGPAPETSHHDS